MYLVTSKLIHEKRGSYSSLSDDVELDLTDVLLIVFNELHRVS